MDVFSPSLQLAFVAGVAYILFRLLQKDVNGLGIKAREQERKRIRELAMLIEIHANRPDIVRRLAKWLHDSS
jgi:hypothetical protein